MSVKFGYNVLLFVFALFWDSSTALYTGDKCSAKDGSDGTCKFITECPNAVELLKTGVYPTICGFEKNESIVCCKQDKATKTNATRITSRTPGDISKQKCKEYAQYAYEELQSPSLLLKPHVSKTFECDLPKYKLVVSTTVASRREFPHMALIGFEIDDQVVWKCGGSLISENFVLTAAHCLFASDASPVAFVRIGLTNKTDLDHVQERTLSEIIPYPKYNRPSLYHDIGLLRLAEKVDFNTYVRPACLQTERDIPYDKAIATGWGRIEMSSEASDVLLKVVSDIISVDNCTAIFKRISNNVYFKDGIMDDILICAGTTSTKKRNTCEGDSGGPLQIYHNETKDIKCMYNIIGVISFGRKDCGLRSPGGHTRVSAYIKWIEDIVWPN